MDFMFEQGVFASILIGGIMAKHGWLGWIIVGGIAGALGKFIMPGKDPGGIIVTILLGIVGALLMGFLGKALGWYDAGEGPGFIAALIGSLILLFAYRMVKGRAA